MSLMVKAYQAPTSFFLEDQAGMDLTLEVQLSVDAFNEVAVDFSINDIKTVLDVTFEDFLLSVDVDSLHVDSVR